MSFQDYFKDPTKLSEDFFLFKYYQIYLHTSLEIGKTCKEPVILE